MSAPPDLVRCPRGGWLGATLDQLEDVLATERRLIGLALLRMTVASIALVYLIGQWPVRHLLWGPNGIFPTWLFVREFPLTRAPSLLATESSLVFEVLYHLALLSAVLYLIGWRTAPVGVLFASLTWSLLRRNDLGMT